MAAFSLTEKLAVTGAFLAIVALVVGTEDDPGLVVTSQQSIVAQRPARSAAIPAADPVDASTVPVAEVAEAPPPVVTASAPPKAASTAAPTGTKPPKQFDPKLGRVPLDFTNGPPGT